ncbi:MAG TPA: hypothetical protein ENJ99_06620, partial [Rhizobiales bacterium]|nr:hypothetical protein [Hyphomicrobiales bacterium]
MATFTVDTIVDEQDGNYSAGDLSLREAIATASAGATIVFDAALAGQTITLTMGEPALAQDLVIDGDTNGDNKADITISGKNSSRIF